MTRMKEFPYGMGWLPDPPDFRDFTIKRTTVSTKARTLGQTESIQRMLSSIGIQQKHKALPLSQDLRQFCSPVEEQGDLGSCTAHAAIGLLEYYENRTAGNFVDASRLFLYKVTRNLSQLTGDTGATLRATMGALTLIGAPPEQYWSYHVEKFDLEPPAFCYALAQNYQAAQYFRLDSPGTSETALLTLIKIFLALGLPLMFGFRVYGCLEYAQDEGGKIPFPTWADNIFGGHAVLAVGYNDNLDITHPGKHGQETTGAILFRNSWSDAWGDNGYGWLPYEYVIQGLAVDWWSLLKSEWVQKGDFGL